MVQPDFGFIEIEHTADWELHAWAPDLPALLEQSARGMYSLSGFRLDSSKRFNRQLDLQAVDAEGLLVGFLSELLYIADQEHIAFDQFALQLDGEQLHANLQGARLLGRDKEIKAVTYHRLKVRSTDHGLEVNIVFDV